MEWIVIKSRQRQEWLGKICPWGLQLSCWHCSLSAAKKIQLHKLHFECCFHTEEEPFLLPSQSVCCLIQVRFNLVRVILVRTRWQLVCPFKRKGRLHRHYYFSRTLSWKREPKKGWVEVQHFAFFQSWWLLSCRTDFVSKFTKGENACFKLQIKLCLSRSHRDSWNSFWNKLLCSTDTGFLGHYWSQFFSIIHSPTSFCSVHLDRASDRTHLAELVRWKTFACQPSAIKQLFVQANKVEGRSLQVFKLIRVEDKMSTEAGK